MPALWFIELALYTATRTVFYFAFSSYLLIAATQFPYKYPGLWELHVFLVSLGLPTAFTKENS